ncbi:hypothetical protein TB1_040900 [Malus domestica]
MLDGDQISDLGSNVKAEAFEVHKPKALATVCGSFLPHENWLARTDKNIVLLLALARARIRLRRHYHV